MGEPYSDRRYDQKDFDASSSDLFSESSSRERDHTPAEYSGSEEAVSVLLTLPRMGRLYVVMLRSARVTYHNNVWQPCFFGPQLPCLLNYRCKSPDLVPYWRLASSSKETTPSAAYFATTSFCYMPPLFSGLSAVHAWQSSQSSYRQGRQTRCSWHTAQVRFLFEF